MDLKIKDVAELLNISETTVRRWVLDGKIPAYRLNHQYRFSRTEIDDWVMNSRISGTDALPTGNEHVLQQRMTEDDAGEKKTTSLGMQQYSLYRAMHKGSVFLDIPGTTKEEVIKNTMVCLAEKLNLDADVITELLLDRENLMPTALGYGLGVPHTRDFLLEEHFDVIGVVFPQEPIDYGSLDGQHVHTLFFLFACEDKRHLHLLSKLAHFASDIHAREFLKTKPSEKALLEYVKKWEKTL
jgi:nitrogen PTS system EIIA component